MIIELLEKLVGFLSQGYHDAIRDRTRQLKDIFPLGKKLSGQEVLNTLEENGMIGDWRLSYLERVRGLCFLRNLHPLEETGGIKGYYFFRNRGKYHLTYAGGMDF